MSGRIAVALLTVVNKESIVAYDSIQAGVVSTPPEKVLFNFGIRSATCFLAEKRPIPLDAQWSTVSTPCAKYFSYDGLEGLGESVGGLMVKIGARCRSLDSVEKV
jgi:hypothetical protein